MLAEALRRDGWTCEYHEPEDRGVCGDCDEAHDRTAAKQIYALMAAGYALVKLPPDDPTNVDRWGNPMFTVGCLTVTAYPERGGHIQLKMTDPDYTCLMWWPGDMREMAAMLLAAANAVEDAQ